VNVPGHFTPQARALQDVGLVHHGHLLPAEPCSLEGKDQRLRDACNIILHHIPGLVTFSPVLAEVDAAHQLPDDDDVNARANDGRLQRAQVRQEWVHLGWSEICRQVEALANSQERVLLAVLPLGLVLLVHRAADGTEEDGIGRGARVDGRLRQVAWRLAFGFGRSPARTPHRGVRVVEG